MDSFNAIVIVLLCVQMVVTFFFSAEILLKVESQKEELEGIKENLNDENAIMKEILEEIEDIRLKSSEVQEKIEQSPRIKAASNNYLYEAQRRAARNMAQEYTPIGNDGGEG